MSNMYNPYGNPFGYGGGNMESIDNQLRQLNELRNQMQPQYQYQQPMPQQNNVAMSNRGTYVYVNDYNDVVNYPTPADGNAVLFFNLDKGILWSKKFVNGSNSIQAFTIAPLNNVSNDVINNTPNNETPLGEPKTDDIINNLLDRTTNLEDKFDKLMEMLQPNKESKTKKVE